MKKLPSWQLKLFYLILFLVPANLALHFPLPSSYVSGILIDYLIPTLYLTDILIIILLISWLSKKPKLSLNPILIFLSLLLPSIIFSSSILPAAYKWFKFLELSLFYLYIKQHLNLKTQAKTITNVLSASIIFQSLLALTQWFKQSSIFGYWFLGEQPYSTATVGIDKITWFDGSLRLPPLGTFPHPNVLGGFLAITLPLVIFKLLKHRKKHSSLAILTLFLGIPTLFLTFSLSAWLAFLLIGIPSVLLLNSNKKRSTLSIFLISSGLFFIVMSIGLNISFLAPQSSFTRRSQLAKISWQMLKENPLVGVGLNNFTVKMENFGFITATTRFLQPVHNIYLLILSETGHIGFIGFLYLIFLSIKKASPVIRSSLLIILFLGLFDHYPLTIQQGLLPLFIFLGLSNSR